MRSRRFLIRCAGCLFRCAWCSVLRPWRFVAGLLRLPCSARCSLHHTHLRAAVAYVIGRGCHVAVRVCYTYKPLDAVVFERCGDCPVWIAFLYALQSLSAAARMCCIQNSRIYIHGVILVTRSITSYLNNRESQFKKLYNCTVIIANIEISFYFSIWKYTFLRIHIWCNNYFIFS